MPLGPQQVLGADLDVGRLPADAAQHLVDHHLGVRQDVPLALGARRQQGRPHARRDADAVRLHVAGDVVHRVVDAHPGRHRPAGRVDVQVDVGLGILELQVQHLGHDQVGAVVVDLAQQEDDAVLEQPAVDVEDALFAAVLFHHERNGRHGRSPGPPGCSS